MKVGAATLAEALRKVLELAGPHISREIAGEAQRVLDRFDRRQRRLASFRSGEIARRRRPS